MADYNVNMKQWNGSSFDNVLPLAFNSKALDGKSYDDIIQYAQSKNLLLYTGQYTGTGTYGQGSPMTLTFPFEPIILFMPIDPQNNVPSIPFPTNTLTNAYKFFDLNSRSNVGIKMSADRKSILFYGSDAYRQFNISGSIYYYAAIGGYDMGGVTEWIITSSGTWTVPKTGKYYIELYGGGGGAVRNSYYQGGSSCQSYDSVALTKGESVPVTIGDKGTGGVNAGSTSFGSYSVNGGGRSTTSSGGNGAGNKGTNGSYYYDVTKNPSTGKFGENYGFGINANVSKDEWGTGGSGAVYLKYLGE